MAEGRGVTVEEATREALGRLGLSEDEVDVEVVSEGRRGLFGGGKRAHVRVKARAASVVPGTAPSGEDEDGEEADPVAATGGGSASASAATGDTQDQEGPHQEGPNEEGPAADEDGDRRSAVAEDAEEAPARTPEEWMDLLDEEAEHAADFMEGLLDRLDLPGDIEIEVHEQQAIVNVLEVGSGLLIGRRGATLDALQELVRGAVQRQMARRSHVRVDVEGYRARQLDKLRDKCREAIAQARESGKPVRLEPMDAYERKLMHDIAAAAGGVVSASEGSEPRRRVVIRPS